MVRKRAVVVLAAVAVVLAGCAPDAYGLRNVNSVESFPVLGEEQTERDVLDPLPDEQIDPTSTRYLGSDDGREFFIGINPEQEMVCLISVLEGASNGQACTDAMPSVATGQPVIGGTFGSGPGYSLWNIQSIGAAEDAGWRRISDLLWTQ